MDIAAIPELNDAIGGVTLTLPEDFTKMDPQFVMNSPVTLDGKQAETYLRYLDANIEFSNQERMERQFRYITALFEAMKNMGEDNQEDMYSLMEEHVLTTLSEEEINTFLSLNLTDSEMKIIPGEWVKGETRDEYYVNEELKRMVIEDFYVNK
jgi:anionic cell wall polymer biosynthesis LytR-Cps2A-Psr (LCP) family protein